MSTTELADHGTARSGDLLAFADWAESDAAGVGYAIRHLLQTVGRYRQRPTIRSMAIHRDNPTTRTVLRLVAAKGVLRPADLQDLGIARTVHRRLVQHGRLTKLGRSLYVLAGADLGGNAQTLPPPDATNLTAVFGHDAVKRTQWRPFLNRANLERPNLELLVAALLGFLLPVVEGLLHMGTLPKSGTPAVPGS